VLQCVAVWCSLVQCVVALIYQVFAEFSLACAGDDDFFVLQCVAVCCSVLQCGAVWCSVVQCVAVCCSVLQCVAVCCSVTLVCMCMCA